MESKSILERHTYEIDKVKEEDKNLVQDILNLLEHTQKACKSWIVTPLKGHYEIVGSVENTDGEWEIFLDELDQIRQLDMFRIPLVSVKWCANIPQIKIRVIPRSERVVIHSTDVIRVQKKRKWWLGELFAS